MRDFKRSRGRRAQYLRVMTGLVVMAALAVISAGAARAAWDMYQKFSEAAAADEAAQQELATLKAQYAAVSSTTQELNTGEGLSAAVRQRWGLGLPGEHEIDIIRQATTSEGTAAQQKGLWGRLWHALFVW